MGDREVIHNPPPMLPKPKVYEIDKESEDEE